MLTTLYTELEKEYNKVLNPITVPLSDYFDIHKDICYDGEKLSLFGATALALVSFTFAMKCVDVYYSADFQKWLKDTYNKKA